MRQLRFWGLLPAFCLLALPLLADNTLKIGDGTVVPKVKVGADVALPLLLDTTDEVQGLVAAFDWPAAKGTGKDLVTTGTVLDDADTVVTRVEPSYMVLGVVMDSDGVNDEKIPPGDNNLLATAEITASPDVAEVGLVDVGFTDGAYATVEGGPELDNIVVVGGLSIGALEGLGLQGGQYEIVEGFPRFYIANAPGNTNATTAGSASVLMENLGPVEGYVVALCFDPDALTLDSIDVGAAAVAQAFDFESAEIFPGGGTLGVVIDLLAPYTNNTIPAGDGNEIAIYNLKCKAPPASGSVEHGLEFCDMVLGAPPKENVMVIGGQSIDPTLENGSFTCVPVGCIPEPEICDDGIDNDCDGKTDLADPDCIPTEQAFLCGEKVKQGVPPGTVLASAGAAAEVCFYMTNPEDEIPGHAQYDHVQGFSMSISYCCDLSARENFDISDTILEALGAEYVMAQADSNPNDGDGCELIIGVLVDALPPFDGATIPPAPDPILLGCVLFDVNEDAECDSCCDIRFEDGLNGRGKVPIRNLVSVENTSASVVAASVDCQVCIRGEERFFRGDCNFSRGGATAVDISDAAAVVSYLFLPGTWKFEPPCLDACDCNDDGRIDLADAVCILRYLFQFGKFPPDPGPGLRETGEPNPFNVEATPAGVDPTDDKLDCFAGGDCF